jgi:hypothetical protein
MESRVCTYFNFMHFNPGLGNEHTLSRCNYQNHHEDLKNRSAALFQKSTTRVKEVPWDHHRAGSVGVVMSDKDRVQHPRTSRSDELHWQCIGPKGAKHGDACDTD